MTINMYKTLQTALVEKDVENIYRDQLLNILGRLSTTTSSKYGTDGVVRAGKYKNEDIELIMLLECKYDMDFHNRLDIIKVLIQALYYLNRFEYYGEDLPNVIMVGDKNECFCLHSNDIKPYLDFENIDWSIAPSSAAEKNPHLIKTMMADDEIIPYVFNVDKNFQFEKVVEKAVELSKEQVNFIRITEKNIDRVFNDFVSNILYHKKITKELANKLVNVFLSVLINPDENYLHPKKPQTLVTKDIGNVRIDRSKFLAFFRHFEKEYTPKEKDKLTSICDRLIEDATRRFQGEFFTPTPWVEEAHRMIEKEFGVDWKEEYVVWDPAWGTGNLTRDYKFKELYVSTLNASDIGIAEQRGYNPEAVKFQFDFLNDPYEKIPQGLKETIEAGRKILVLMNPPYGRSSGVNTFGSIKKGSAATTVATEMRKLGMANAASQLYAQFLFRIVQMSGNINIATFCPPLFMSGSSYFKFRKLFTSKMYFTNGMLFKASHFSNVSTQWGISFSLWKRDIEAKTKPFIHKVKDLEKGFVVTKFNKLIYNVDNSEKLSVILGHSEKPENFPKLTSPLKVKDTKYGCGLPSNAFGTFVCHSNNVAENPMSVYIINSGITRNVGKSFIKPKNFNKVTAVFTARKTIKSDWINQKDEYLTPNTEHPDYEQWNNDCLVYSLFNNSSNQSSLRNIEYKEKTWDIKNQWFWMSREFMESLADICSFDALYKDVRAGNDERFVFNKLKTTKLSDDAYHILQLAESLVEGSFEYRETLHQEHPEYHLNAWDAGWYQIKLILKEFMPDRLKEFREEYKKFEKRMEKGVYKFGFLRK